MCYWTQNFDDFSKVHSNHAKGKVKVEQVEAMDLLQSHEKGDDTKKGFDGGASPML